MKKKSKFIKVHKTHAKILLAIFILIGVPVSLFFIYVINFYQKIYPNVYVDGVNIGGLTKTQAKSFLLTLKTLPSNITIKVNSSISESSFEIDPRLLKPEFSIEETLKLGYQKGRSGALWEDVRDTVSSIFVKSEYYTNVDISESEFENLLNSIRSTLGPEAQAPKYIFDNGVKVVDGTDGEYIDEAEFKKQLLDTLSNKKEILLVRSATRKAKTLTDDERTSALNFFDTNLNKKITLTESDFVMELDTRSLVVLLTPSMDVSDVELSKLVDEISSKIDREPQNAYLSFEDNRVNVFRPSLTGKKVDKKQTANIIRSHLLNNLGSEIKIPVMETKPSVDLSDINNLGIKSLIGVGKSEFRGSIPSRIHNVELASSRINGFIVAPGEVFSFNKAVGDISMLTGYKQAYVIKDGRTVLGDGGGVCQVSTTLFRAVLAAGLPILERKPHSYRVGYYEQGSPVGIDASVYAPLNDLKFKNDTPEHVLIQTKVDKKNLTAEFQIYGTDDGRKVELTKPVISSQVAPAEDLYVDDPTLPVGQIKQVEHKAWGARVSFDYKVTKDDIVLTKQTFTSLYRPWQAIYQRGTRPI